MARAIHEAGGRAVLVGGYVRDTLLEIPSKDVDIEVFGLDIGALEDLLSHFGKVAQVGSAFGVLRVKGIDADFSLPREESKVGRGHRGFRIRYEPAVRFARAARRRDLTINSMGYDLIRHEFLDPYEGRRDLEENVLRATDPEHFAEDPLRGLRVAQFAARFEMTPDEELKRLCSELDLSELSARARLRGARQDLLEGALAFDRVQAPAGDRAPSIPPRDRVDDRRPSGGRLASRRRRFRPYDDGDRRSGPLANGRR